MNDKNQFIIVKREGILAKFVRHEGHQHYWTKQRDEAMEYTKLEVAQGIAAKMGGKVEAIN